SYKGTKEVDGRLLHVYQLKPRKKRVGLFKGHIYLDAHTGSLVRAEGRAVKSPSFFVKRIEFAQDYADFGPFTFPVHVHSEARHRTHYSQFLPRPQQCYKAFFLSLSPKIRITPHRFP